MYNPYLRNTKTNLPLRYLKSNCKIDDNEINNFLDNYTGGENLALYDLNGYKLLMSEVLTYISNRIIDNCLIPHNESHDFKYKWGLLYLHYQELKSCIFKPCDSILEDKVVDYDFLKNIQVLVVDEIELIYSNENSNVYDSICSLLKIRYDNLKSTIVSCYEVDTIVEPQFPKRFRYNIIKF